MRTRCLSHQQQLQQQKQQKIPKQQRERRQHRRRRLAKPEGSLARRAITVIRGRASPAGRQRLPGGTVTTGIRAAGNARRLGRVWTAIDHRHAGRCPVGVRQTCLTVQRTGVKS